MLHVMAPEAIGQIKVHAAKKKSKNSKLKTIVLPQSYVKTLHMAFVTYSQQKHDTVFKHITTNHHLWFMDAYIL